MGDELVELGFSNQILEVEQEVEALFVWDAGECIIGILALEIDDELGKFVVGAKVIDRVRQCLHPIMDEKCRYFSPCLRTSVSGIMEYFGKVRSQCSQNLQSRQPVKHQIVIITGMGIHTRRSR